MTQQAAMAPVRVELFGLPRLRSGQRAVELALPLAVTRRQVVTALAQACPALVGCGLREDLADLQEGYLFNRNGTAFLTGEEIQLEPGDCLLLLSSQAGG
jgi:hypothetical protein